MSKCVFGPSISFGHRHSARVCTQCGAIGVFLDGELCATFNEDGDELQKLTCKGSMLEAAFALEVLQPDTLQVSREGLLAFQIVERGERLTKMSPG